MINFHSHINHDSDEVAVVSLSIAEANLIEPVGLYTIGIHPWNTTDSDIDKQLDQLVMHAKDDSVIAIGEIGLDRLKGAPLSKQIEILNKQILVAQKVSKPIVIHCVRAWAEIINIKKNSKSTVNWAIHGFRGNPELAKQLIDNDFYLSFGTNIIDATPSLAEALSIAPMNRFFFETDESPIPVYEVYSAASDILNIPISELKKLTTVNFMEFFKR